MRKGIRRCLFFAAAAALLALGLLLFLGDWQSLYLLTAAAGAVILAVYEFQYEGVKKRAQARAFFQERFGKCQDEETQTALRDGRAVFGVMIRRAVCTQIGLVYFFCGFFLFFWKTESRTGIEGKDWLTLGFMYAVCLLLFLLQQRLWGKEALYLLKKEGRPLTAACVILMELSEGYAPRRGFRVLYHNCAVALYRSGDTKGAWQMSEYGRSLGRGRIRAGSQTYLDAMECQLRWMCLRDMGQDWEAEAELSRYQELLRRKPSLRKLEGIQYFLDTLRMRQAMDQGNWERARACGEIFLEECREEYYCLSVYGYLRKVYAALGMNQEAEEMLRRLLSQSPERREVKETLSWINETAVVFDTRGQKPSSQSPVKVPDHVGLFLRLILSGASLLLVGSLLILGIGDYQRQKEDAAWNKEFGENRRPGGHREPGADRNPGKDQESGENWNPGKDQEPGADRNPGKDQEPGTGREPGENQDIQETQDGSSAPPFTLTLPESWQGKYVEDNLRDGSRVYRQRSSYSRMGDGTLFSITVVSDGSYVNLPDYEIWGYDGPYVYVMSMPTDVSFYTEDAAIREEYSAMGADVAAIRTTFQIHSPTAAYDGGEYVFPNSGAVYLKEEDLLNLSAETLRIAKNEIYARHGRRFQDALLQQYFNNRLWYDGRIDPADFDEGVLNACEKANIQTIQNRQMQIE